MDLLNRDGSIRQICLLRPLNALLTSDHHFSNRYGYFSVESVEETMKCFSRLIRETRPDQILVLGDLFHYGQENNHFVLQIMTFFRDLEQEIFLIGGNHDKVLIEDQIQKWSKDNLHIYPDSFIVYKTNQEKIWFTHDGNNPYWLDKQEVPGFLINLKKVYTLPKHHWLITGHTHLPCLINDSKVASLGCFNVEGHNQPLSYGIAEEIGDQISFSLQEAEKVCLPEIPA
ncbi:MAG: metallophosphoesterase [Candidatus Thorarchaeota archaeon]